MELVVRNQAQTTNPEDTVLINGRKNGVANHSNLNSSIWHVGSVGRVKEPKM